MVKIAVGCMACTTIPKYVQEIRSVIETWYHELWENDMQVYFFVGEKIGEEESSLETSQYYSFGWSY